MYMYIYMYMYVCTRRMYVLDVCIGLSGLIRVIRAIL